MIEKLSSEADTIDRIRNTMVKTVQDSIMEGFSRPITDREQEGTYKHIIRVRY